MESLFSKTVLGPFSTIKSSFISEHIFPPTLLFFSSTKKSLFFSDK